MKKVILSAVILASIGTSMMSCKKNYVCKCSKTYTTGTGSTTNDYSDFTYDDTRSRAVSRCNANDATSSDLGGNYSINCAIQ